MLSESGMSFRVQWGTSTLGHLSLLGFAVPSLPSTIPPFGCMFFIISWLSETGFILILNTIVKNFNRFKNF